MTNGNSAILQEVISKLEELRIAYMVSGSAASAEDTLMAKLEWFRAGGEVSENHWRDILGILKVQSSKLDLAYLTHWCRELHVDDLLTRALQESRA